ncbi:MAG: relaxase/mobilization nuclease domain-containing protein [Hyphomicrobium sp.]|jgi:hypothetical protein|uniref:relaxase/mobilization nuclease domain-containing protein n=1 Tax=Hyphomicrobium sp. TaxID=82 RepID=UPI0025C2CFB4|nr:relaxase/mobilization nuclease domain-containing protein [Hyphomicrobium sp.]MBX9861144.1 relaxase/mobilization nuclease domain-containing protein [Hyphomicrobium sp.]
MLAKVAPPTNDFLALARYLVRGKSGNRTDPKRVAWVATQNLPTTDPELAARYMGATAQLSARTKSAAYHLMIAWHARERPTPEVMQAVATVTLELAGLAEHQALIMGHGDKPHPHLHILLNRVHPESGRAWKTSHDFARFDRIMKELAETYGFEFAPAHTFNPERTDTQEKLPNSAATYAARRGARTTRPQWSKDKARKFGAEISERLSANATHDDFRELLAADGLRLEAKGQGFVVGDDSTYAKLSSLGLAATARTLARRRDYTPSHPHINTSVRQHRSVFAVDAVDVARAFHTLGLLSREDVQAAMDDARAERRQRQQETALSRATHTTALTAFLSPREPQSRRLPAGAPRTHPKAR